MEVAGVVGKIGTRLDSAGELRKDGAGLTPSSSAERISAPLESKLQDQGRPFFFCPLKLLTLADSPVLYEFQPKGMRRKHLHLHADSRLAVEQKQAHFHEAESTSRQFVRLDQRHI